MLKHPPHDAFCVRGNLGVDLALGDEPLERGLRRRDSELRLEESEEREPTSLQAGTGLLPRATGGSGGQASPPGAGVVVTGDALRLHSAITAGSPAADASAATRTAFSTIRAFARPWVTMLTPRTPRSGAPP